MEITLEGVSPIGITPESLDYSCQPVKRPAGARDKEGWGEDCPPTALTGDPSGGGNGRDGPARGWGKLGESPGVSWRSRS